MLKCAFLLEISLWFFSWLFCRFYWYYLLYLIQTLLFNGIMCSIVKQCRSSSFLSHFTWNSRCWPIYSTKWSKRGREKCVVGMVSEYGIPVFYSGALLLIYSQSNTYWSFNDGVVLYSDDHSIKALEPLIREYRVFQEIVTIIIYFLIKCLLS